MGRVCVMLPRVCVVALSSLGVSRFCGGASALLLLGELLGPERRRMQNLMYFNYFSF